LVTFALFEDEAAVARVDEAQVAALTRAATDATFYREGMNAEQIAANRHVVAISGPTAMAAAASDRQRLVAALVERDLAGFVIATRHAADNLELDWLMVDPAHHGSGLAARLMEAALHWLGAGEPIWLTVIQHNERAIRFYRRFGFEIEGETDPKRPVPTWIMRRTAGTLG
jgi:ribosomal protein S18 acetylase RimI-like enzyme